MICCTLLLAHSNIAIILMGKRELVASLNLSSWCLMMVAKLFLAVPWGCLIMIRTHYFCEDEIEKCAYSSSLMMAHVHP